MWPRPMARQVNDAIDDADNRDCVLMSDSGGPFTWTAAVTRQNRIASGFLLRMTVGSSHLRLLPLRVVNYLAHVSRL